ncbi:hypothetical protein ACIPUD_11045 [Bradyrhizobium sp. CAR08]
MSQVLLDYARKEIICSLAIVENAAGKEMVHLMVEAHLQALSTYLRGSIGAEAAFEVFSRYADEIIQPAVDAGAVRS